MDWRLPSSPTSSRAAASNSIPSRWRSRMGWNASVRFCRMWKACTRFAGTRTRVTGISGWRKSSSFRNTVSTAATRKRCAPGDLDDGARGTDGAGAYAGVPDRGGIFGAERGREERGAGMMGGAKVEGWGEECRRADIPEMEHGPRDGWVGRGASFPVARAFRPEAFRGRAKVAGLVKWVGGVREDLTPEGVSYRAAGCKIVGAPTILFLES